MADFVFVSCRDSPARTSARLLALVLIITSSSPFKLSPLSLILLPSCYYVYNTQYLLGDVFCVHLFHFPPRTKPAIFLCASPGCVFIFPFLWHQSTNVLAWETKVSAEWVSYNLFLCTSPRTRLCTSHHFWVVVWYSSIGTRMHNPGWLLLLTSSLDYFTDFRYDCTMTLVLPSSFVFFISLNSLYRRTYRNIHLFSVFLFSLPCPTVL